MIVEVHYVGNEFVAYTEQGVRITDRSILDQISFDQFPGYKSVVKLEVDNSTNDNDLNSKSSNKLENLTFDASTNIKRRKSVRIKEFFVDLLHLKKSDKNASTA